MMMLKRLAILVMALCCSIFIWQPFPATAGIITPWDYDQIRSSIAYNPDADEYLVVWEQEITATNHDILGQRLNGDGTLLGGLVYVARDPARMEARPTVVYNEVADEYLVVYEYSYSDTDYDIHAQRLSRYGSLIGTPIYISRLTNFEGRPAVAHNSNNDEYLIAWEHRVGSDEFSQNDIRAIRLGSDGTLLGSVLVLDQTTLDESAPQIGYSGTSDRYLVAWQEKQDGTWVYNIHGKMVSSMGTLLAGELAIATWEYDLIKPRLAYNSLDNEFLVVWEDHRWGWGDDWNIYGQRVSGNGYLTGDNFGIAWKITGRANHRMSPDVAYKAAANEYLVVWEYAYSPTDFDIYARRVAADGTLMEGELSVATSGIFEAAPIVATDDGLDYLVVWEQGPGSQGIDLYGEVFPLHELSGNVYAGNSETPRAALSNVGVDLFCSNNIGDVGDPVYSALTHEDGSYHLFVAGSYEFYNIIENDLPNFVSTEVETTSGTVISKNWIQYSHPIAGTDTTGNQFYDEEILPPGGWANFQPSDVVYQGSVNCSIQVSDTIAGLDVSSSQYAYSTDGGLSWSAWIDATCTGTNGTTNVETLTTGDVYFGQDSGTDHLNRIRFQIRDLAGNRGQSTPYLVEIDAAPPVITSGPSIVELTTNSARIRWETDKAADSRVGYGRQAGLFTSEVTEPPLVTVHEVLLPSLDASATYHVVVHSTAANGQSVESDAIRFETDALPDGEDPTVSLIAPEAYAGVVSLSADAADNTGIEKVQYFMDDQLLHTAFGPDLAFDLDTAQFSNGEHTLKVAAYDLSGRLRVDEQSIQVVNIIDASDPSVTITAPSTDWQSVSGTVNVTASLSDDTGLAQVFFKVDGIGESFKPLPDHPKSQTVTFQWDSTGVPNGNHTLAVEVYDADTPYANYAFATRPVVVNQVPPPLPPKLKMSHTVARYSNYFAVELTVTNVGDETATSITIDDFLRGFQPISGSQVAPVHATYQAQYESWKHEWQCTITSSEDIPANTAKTFTYFVVPVMLDATPITPEIGFSTGVHYDKDERGLRIHEWFAVPVPKVFGGETLSQAYDDALKSADYLIVTHPNRLFAFGPAQTSDVFGLFSDMAELARYRNGVLAFLDNYDKDMLKKLIRPGLALPFSPETYIMTPGAWSGKLDAGWPSNGYLLLVGENQIVPGWSRKLGSFETSTGATHTWIANPTDYPYADNTGDELYPELSLGRIIGDTPAALRTPIRTSINVAMGVSGFDFDRTHSLLISGFPKGLNGGSMNILTAQEVDNVLDQVLDKPVAPISAQTVWHTPSHSVVDGNGVLDQAATQAAVRSAFLADTPDQDVIFLAGHGNSDSWDAIDRTTIANQTKPFGGVNPFVFASSCKTGDYTGGSRFAEAFLSQGAGAYLGAVIEGACFQGKACPNADTFFKKWDINEPLGLALKQTKRGLYLNKVNRIWSGIYHLFGDPKYGALPAETTAATDVDEPMAATAAASVEIDVPAYQISLIDGEDYVDILGGNSFYVTGMPVVPFYQVVYDYPKGFQIQDVRLVEQSEAITETDLNLPIGIMGVLGCCDPLFEVEPPEIPPWWPEKAFDWRIIEKPDGVSLALTVFPFVYNHQTGEALFYDHYRFDISYDISDVTVVDLATDKPVYAPGEPVAIKMLLGNTGEARDVVVEAVITQEGSDEISSGLFLRTLNAFDGHAAWSETWPGDLFPPGYYHLRVEIRDPQGAILERRIETFRIGIAAARIEDLTVAPEHFSLGERVAVSLSVVNTGTEILNGTVVINIQNGTGATMHDSRQVVPSLLPGESLDVNTEWDTTGSAPGQYKVAGYFLFDGMSTEPGTQLISTSSCWSDSDHDGDVDGKDLYDLLTNEEYDAADVSRFVGEFGRPGCM